MARRQQKRKIVSVRKKRPINIDLVFFGAVAVYICVVCYMGMTSEHIAGYEVTAGILSVNHTYTGLAIRTETLYNAETSGYVSYYARDGERVSGTALVYTIDEKGDINKLIQQNAENVDLTDENFSVILNDVKGYMSSYQNLEFSGVYDFKASLEGSVIDLMNQNMLETLEEAGEDSMFSRIYASGIGILEYYMDGFESATVESLTEEMLDASNYEKQSLKKELIQSGEPVYKLSTSEKWSLIVPLTEEEAAGFQAEERKFMEVEFTRDHTRAWADFSLIYVGSVPCAKLDFNNSMVRFADLRYIEVEFLVKDETGLKIPNTALTEKKFLVIPKDYYTYDKDTDSNGVISRYTGEDGNVVEEFIAVSVAGEKKGKYYIASSKLKKGDTIIHPETAEKYTMDRQKTLKGVYNINRGYAVFRKVEALAKNQEYTIINTGTDYGISLYDHIALDASAVKELQTIQ